MGSGLLRELHLLKKIGSGGGLRDGSGCGNPCGTITHGLDSRMRNCRQVTQTDVIPQAPNANRRIKLLTVAHSSIAAFLIRRQLHIPGLEKFAFADSCVLIIGGADPDHGLWLAA